MWQGDGCKLAIRAVLGKGYGAPANPEVLGANSVRHLAVSLEKECSRIPLRGPVKVDGIVLPSSRAAYRPVAVSRPTPVLHRQSTRS
jgi:hypothetical protein